MKRLEYAERMTLEELEAVASDSSVEAPSGLKEKLNALVLASEELEAAQGRQHRRSACRKQYFFGLSAAVALASLALVVAIPTRPKDTFTDPVQAYEEIEKVFSMISDRSVRSLEMAKDAYEPVVEKTNRIFDNK